MAGKESAGYPGRVNEAATAIAELVASSGFPKQAARDLARLLGHELAVDDTPSLRFARLGLLQSLVAQTGEFVSSSYYEHVRAERRAQNEEWPTAATLSRLYGSWISAVKAACRFIFHGGSTRVASSHAHCLPQRSYQPTDIIDALIRCQDELGLRDTWPTQWEYEEWAKIKRDLSHKSGNPCRLPGLKQIRDAYGSFANAVQATRVQCDVQSMDSRDPSDRSDDQY